ncbi:PAS domain-containing sensor histidine kinase [candidate division KSB1 bacterium]|nr:PAS domain-containing sensor histidine kinase [candidate division KSB1 bacterium]
MNNVSDDKQSGKHAAAWHEILDRTHDAVYLLGPGGVILDVNGQFCRMLKQPREALLGTLLTNWMDRESRQYAERTLGQLLKTGAPLRSTRVYQTIDKERVTTEALETPHLAGHAVTHISGIARDISHEVTLERKMWDTAEAHEQSVEFALRTSLGLVKGYIYTLGQANELDADRRRRYVRVIEDEIDQLSKLIEDLLDVRKLDTAEIDLRGGAIDVVECARSAVRRCEAEAERREIQIITRIPDDAAPLFGSTEAMYRIVLNLLQNAVQHTMHSGRVELELDDAEDWLEIRVRDNGVGIPERELPHIFDRFYRGSAAIGSATGIGLGLAITETFVKAMGGRIRAKSAPGQGSEFAVVLPRRPVGGEAEAKPRATSTPTANSMTIPLV